MKRGKPLQRHTRLKAGKPLKRGKRLVPRSARRTSEIDARHAVVAEAILRDRNTCRAKDLVLDVRCFGPLDPHEVIPRSAWSGGYLVLDNVVMVCRGHHDWIGDNPDAAHAAGLHGYSWERPDRARPT